MNICPISFNQNYSNYNNKALNFKASLSADSDDFKGRDKLERLMETRYKNIDTTYTVKNYEDDNIVIAVNKDKDEVPGIIKRYYVNKNTPTYNIIHDGRKMFHKSTQDGTSYKFYDPASVIEIELERQERVGTEVYQALIMPFNHD